MDLSQAINTVANLSATAAIASEKNKVTTEQIDLKHEPYKYLLRIGEQITERDKPLKPWSCTVDSLEDLIDLARYNAAGEGAKPDEVTIWHNENQVVVRRETSPRVPYAVFKFRKSEAYQKVLELDDSWYTQKEFIRLLRSDLPQVVREADALTAAVRQLDFRSQSTATGLVTLGKESMGREIASEVTGAGVLPETVALRVTMYDNAAPVDSWIQVNGDLDVDLQAYQLAIRPLAAELTAGQQAVANALHDWLEASANEGVKDKVIAVYRGTFNF